MAVSANIFEKCLPARSLDLTRCGDPTLCDISPTTSDELASIYKDGSDRFRIIGSLLESDFLGKACEVVENGFYDFMQANTRELGPRKVQMREKKRGLYEVEPFVLMESKGPINNEAWTATTGNSAGGTFNGAAYDYRVDVQSQTSIPNSVDWFPERISVYIETLTAGGTKSTSYWKVAGSEISGASIRLYLVEQNTASPFSAAQKAPPLGTQKGVLYRGTPVVNRYEKYCAEIPAINTTRETMFFIEENRYTLCDSELWRKFIGYIKDGNPYYAQFMHVEDVDRNRQIIQDFQRRAAWDFLFRPALPNQDSVNWKSLAEIKVHSDDGFGNYVNHPLEGRCIGRRAQAEGLYHQWKRCGRIIDAQGQPLNIPELTKLLYELLRTREDNGVMIKDEGYGPIITAYTDQEYAFQIAQGFYKYFKLISDSTLQMNMDLSKDVKKGVFGFRYLRFALPYPMCEFRLATHKFYDDRITYLKRADPTLANAGRGLWLIDWSTNWQGMIESRTVTNKTGTIQDIAAVNEDYMCVMDIPQESRQLRSFVKTNVSECPGSSFLIENLSNAVPEYRGASEGGTGTLNYYGGY